MLGLALGRCGPAAAAGAGCGRACCEAVLAAVGSRFSGSICRRERGGAGARPVPRREARFPGMGPGHGLWVRGPWPAGRLLLQADSLRLSSGDRFEGGNCKSSSGASGVKKESEGGEK